MVLWAMLERSDATCVEDFPKAVGGVGVRMAELGGHDAGIEADEDEDEIWTKSIAEVGNDGCRGRGG